jgi:hypothetical protein
VSEDSSALESLDFKNLVHILFEVRNRQLSYRLLTLLNRKIKDKDQHKPIGPALKLMSHLVQEPFTTVKSEHIIIALSRHVFSDEAVFESLSIPIKARLLKNIT